MKPNRKPSERGWKWSERFTVETLEWIMVRSPMRAIQVSTMRSWLRAAYLAGWRARARTERKREVQSSVQSRDGGAVARAEGSSQLAVRSRVNRKKGRK